MILVVGDVMLDEYLYGEATRLAQEAPVPIISLSNERPDVRLGGAANVAASIAALGAEVMLLGPFGVDRSETLGRLCTAAGIKLAAPAVDYGTGWSMRTTVKTRIIDRNGRILARLDSEGTKPWKSDRVLGETLNFVRPDVIVFSDYAKGCWTQWVWDTVVKHTLSCFPRDGKPRLLVDAKRSLDCYEGAHIIKCNEHEWVQFGGETLCPHNAIALVTKGKRGLSYGKYDGIWKWQHVSGHEVAVYNVTGAGDVVAAVVAVGMLRDCDMRAIAESAVKASGVSVTKPFTGVADPNDVSL